MLSVNSFFKFEKSSQVYKYQVDYNPLTDDYLETLDHLGYEHVCCMQDMHIYRNVNLNAEDLSSDEDVLCEAKLKMFKPWAIAMCHSCGYDLLWRHKVSFLGLYRFSWGSLLLNLDVCFSSFLVVCRLVFYVLFRQHCLSIVKETCVKEKNVFLSKA